MNLLQLRYILEVCKHGNHISNTARALHTTQPGISKHIQMLEAELGFSIFTRTRNRISGLTEPGCEIVVMIRRVLNDIDNMKRVGEEVSAREVGDLTVATTHTHARFVLPKMIEEFIRRYPNVQLRLMQGNPTQICELVETGEADIAIGTEASRVFPSLIRLPCLQLERCIITKVGHPLLKVTKPTLRDVAKYPIITYGSAYSGRWKVMDAFKSAGIEPNIVFVAVDADVSKTYVELGLGIAVVTVVAFDRQKDKGLRSIDASHLFQASTTSLSLRSISYMRSYTYDFIHMVAPHITRQVVDDAMQKAR